MIKGIFFFYDSKNLLVLISKIFQIFLKKKYISVPIIKRKFNFNNLSKLQNFKNVFFNLKENYKINFSDTFEDIIFSINVANVDYLYITEDLFWIHNDLTQSNKKIDDHNLKKLLLRIMFSGCVIKKLK